MSGYGREDRREARLWFLSGIGAWIATVIVLGVIAAAVWGVRVLISDVRGQGDAVIQRNSAANWTAAQGRFEGWYAEYEATLVRIDNLEPQVAAKPDDQILTTQLNGLRSYCTSVAADFNADARTFLAGDFRAADLPAQLDLNACNH